MDRYMLDLLASIRSLARSRGTALIAVAALAMGIGFTTTMFSIVRGGTRSLPFAEPEELLILTATLPRTGSLDLRARAFDYLEWSRQQTSFENLAAFTTDGFNLSGEGARPERVSGTLVTPGTFAMLGESPAFGRSFIPADAATGAEPVVILSHGLWTNRFASDPGILGTNVRIDGTQRTVIAVMPEEFAFPIRAAAWIPLGFDAASEQPRRGPSYTVFGRLRDGVDADRAAIEMATIAERMAAAYPETHEGAGIRVYPFTEMEMPREISRALYLMVGAVSLVLLIACANVANLLLARAATRTHEVAIRTALGASRKRIIIGQLAESVMLAAVGAVIGLLFARAAVRFFAVSTDHIIEAFWMQFEVDAVVVVFASLLGIVAAAAAGIAPALRASAFDVASTLKDRPGSSSLRIGRLSRSLVGIQVAFACGLLIVTALFVNSALQLRATRFPYVTQSVFTAQIGFTAGGSVAGSNERLIALEERIAAVPGVTAATITSHFPGRGAVNEQFRLEGRTFERAQDMPYTTVTYITPGYLETLQSAPLRGRNLTWLDDADAPGAILVNSSWAATFSTDRDPLGRRLYFGDREYAIVGIVPDLMPTDIENEVQHAIYLPFQQSPYAWNVRIMARTQGDALGITAAVRDAAAEIDPDVPLFEIATLHDTIFADKRVLDAFGVLFFLFGIGATFMTVVGLYGVVAFAVSQRTREIGIRVALGATGKDVTRLVVGQGGKPVLIGLVFGSLLAIGLSAALAAAIEPIERPGIALFTGVLALIGGTTLLSMVAPARRALSVQPVTALRSD
jgi:predicted permease